MSQRQPFQRRHIGELTFHVTGQRPRPAITDLDAGQRLRPAIANLDAGQRPRPAIANLDAGQRPHPAIGGALPRVALCGTGSYVRKCRACRQDQQYHEMGNCAIHR
jgi:hypothetical protein